MCIFGNSERITFSQPQKPIRVRIVLKAIQRQNTHRTVLWLSAFLY